MTDLCQDIDLFTDGVLDETRAEAFRQHLPACQRCQAELADRVQLRLLTDEYGRHVVPRRTRRRAQTRSLVVGAAAITAGVIVALLVRGMVGQDPADAWLTTLPHRPLNARLSYPGIDGYRERPLAKMMGPAVEARVLPLQKLAELEKHGDLYGLLAAYLVREDWKNAQEILGKIHPITTEEKDSLANDEAVLRLGDGNPEEALRLLDNLLERRPDHMQARWNRALTLEALRLDLTAAEAFAEIATQGEPGWATEASERAKMLREPMEKRRARWFQIQEAAQKWIRGAQLPPEALADPLPILRLHFYEAVRAAPSAERILALLSVAQKLDPRGVLEQYARDVASHTTDARGRLAGMYVQLLDEKPGSKAWQALAKELRRAQEADLRLGALVQTGALTQHLDELEHRTILQDPWFQVLALEEHAKVLAGNSKLKDSLKRIEEARRLCQSAGVIYRCLALNFKMAYVFIDRDELDLARAAVEEGLRLAAATGEWESQRQFIQGLFDIARFQNRPSLARAYAAETIAFARGDYKEKEIARHIHQGMAHMKLHELRFGDARHELDETTRTSTSLTLVGALVLADVARKLPEPDDETHLRRALDPIRGEPRSGRQALATHTWGRFFIESDPARRRHLLQDAIREAGAKHDANARRARMHSFTLLILDAGKRGDYEEALRLFGEEQSWTLPSRCMVAATAETERSLVIVRGASGELLGFFEGARQERLGEELGGLVPPDAIALLGHCERVDVFARPPLLGRRPLLPPELPWAYRVREAPPRPQAVGPGTHIVIANVMLPSQVKRKRLRPLPTWTAEEPGAELRFLDHNKATPASVLRELAQARDADIITHGLVSEAGKPFLVLAEDSEGNFKLTADQIGDLTLAHAPFVVLAACEAGDAAPGVHETHSLPEAFARAGARGVIAATTEIPYEDAKRFFPALRARIRSGEPPVIALWRERAAWLQRGQGTRWLSDVYLVE